MGALCCISGVVGPLLMEGRKLDEMNLIGNPISAKEAMDAGLVTYLTSQDEMTKKASSVLDDLAKVSSISNSSFKRIRRSAISRQSLSIAYQELLTTITSRDFREGSRAFVAKGTARY